MTLWHPMTGRATSARPYPAVLHILFNVQAVRALRLNALNRERVRILLRRFRWHRAVVAAAAGRTVAMTRGGQAWGLLRTSIRRLLFARGVLVYPYSHSASLSGECTVTMTRGRQAGWVLPECSLIRYRCTTIHNPLPLHGFGLRVQVCGCTVTMTRGRQSGELGCSSSFAHSVPVHPHSRF